MQSLIGRLYRCVGAPFPSALSLSLHLRIAPASRLRLSEVKKPSKPLKKGKTNAAPTPSVVPAPVVVRELPAKRKLLAFNNPIFFKDPEQKPGFLLPNRRFKKLVPFQNRARITEDETISVNVLDLKGQLVGTEKVSFRVFDAPIRPDIVHRVVEWSRSLRFSHASAKDRSRIRKSNRKIRPQKGSGQARAGTSKAPRFRGGGKAHGPIPRSMATDLNTKIRKMGMRSVLTAKLQSGQLVIIDSLELESHRTGPLRSQLQEAKLKCQNPIFYSLKKSTNFYLATRNLPFLAYKSIKHISVMDLLRFGLVAISRDSINYLTHRYLP